MFQVPATGNLRKRRLSGLDSSSTLSKPTTLCRKTCNSGCEDGSLVTSNNGWNTSGGSIRVPKVSYDTAVKKGSRLTPNNVLEVVDLLGALEHFIQPRYLDEPSQIVREQLVFHHPFRQFVPLVYVAAINAQPPFHILEGLSALMIKILIEAQRAGAYLVLALFGIRNDLCVRSRIRTCTVFMPATNIPRVSSAKYRPPR